MIFLYFCRLLNARLMAAGLFLIVWGSMASALDWVVSYKQNQVVALPVQTLSQAASDEGCPDHFRLAQLSAAFDLETIGSIGVRPARNYNTGKFLSSLAPAPNPAVTMQIALTGCVFRRYFLPQTGEVTLSGAFGDGGFETKKFVYGSDNPPDMFSMSYSALLTGTATRTANNPALAELGLSKDRAMGDLSLRFPLSIELPLVSGDDTGAVVYINWLRIRIVVMPEDDIE